MPNAPLTIGSGTQKGGPGKTTLAANIAASLALAGNRVVALDLDLQGDLTVAYGVEPTAGRTAGSLVVDKTLRPVDLLVDKSDALTGNPHADRNGRLWVMPSLRQDLLAAENQMRANPVAGMYAVRRIVNALGEVANWVVIDCRPDLDILVGAAAAASDGVFSSCEPQMATMRGALAFEESMRELREAAEASGHDAPGSRTKYMGVVRNKWEDGEEANWVEQALVEGDIPMFKTVIPRSKYASKAYIFGRPAVLHYPNSAVASSYIALTAEIVEKLEGEA